MLFGPAFKNLLEVGAPLDGFFEGIVIIFIEVIFDGVGGDHEVENDSLIIQAFYGVAHYILNMLCI